MKRAVLLALAIMTPGAAAQPDDPVDGLLRRARMSHEPDAVIRAAVERLDERLDANPRDERAWLEPVPALRWARR